MRVSRTVLPEVCIPVYTSAGESAISVYTSDPVRNENDNRKAARINRRPLINPNDLKSL
jgi:hypothetical protein